jgi:CheY-like chemotaxis protein
MVLVRRLQILLVEDNPINQKVAARLLEKHGHTVVIARNGREALALLDGRAFDLVLMDVQMPEMDGLEATAAIRRREHGTGQRLPIVALTAQATTDDRARCFQVGMDGYLTKPVRTQVLLQALAEIMAL